MMVIYSLNELLFDFLKVFSQDSEWSVLSSQAIRFQKKDGTQIWDKNLA